MILEEKLYTSTEVAEILGVSLRSVYRYLDEGKIQAEVKTATGRHRFTKQNILDFLYPNGEGSQEKRNENKEPVIKKEQVETKAPVEEVQVNEQVIEEKKVEEKPEIKEEKKPVIEEKEDIKEEEPVDWLEKFRAAAAKYKEEEAKNVDTEKVESMADYFEQPEKPQASMTQYYYYRSLTGGLKDIAQNIDKSARKAYVDYAFTMNAGLSLHKPIKPFSILHAYIRPEDREFFERMLNLVTSDENTAQLCLITTGDKALFDGRKEMHGLFVVSDLQLKKDLSQSGEEQLVSELDSLLNS